MSLFVRQRQPVLGPMLELPWASGAVFNPGAWYDGERVHLLFRAVAAGYRRVRLPQSRPYEAAFGFEPYVSCIGYAWSTDGVHFTVHPEPVLRPEEPYERFGVEDPRVARFGDRYLITYTALGRPAFEVPGGVRIALAATRDFLGIEKWGLIGPDHTDKDAVLFPRPIGGRIGLLHRIAPSIQLAWFDSLEALRHPPAHYWGDHLRELERHTILRPEFPWEAKKIGAGPTPIETEHGWLLLYHGVDARHVYRMGAALLDREDPSRVVARSPIPLLEPELDFERHGDVPNVVFPQGAVVLGDELYVYYGAADKRIGLARAPLDAVLSWLLDVCVLKG
ncbi:MAG: glycosidase [Bacteroidota bacterium]|nr:glycosidase [Bacteroidota bacterium]MDW8138073.1 glycosidase [Bacteroidota bacterium]